MIKKKYTNSAAVTDSTNTNDKKKSKKEKTSKKEKAPKKEKESKKSITTNKRVDSKVEQDKSQIAKDLNIRISSPYGYYPDDVDPLLSNYKNEISNLLKENKTLTDNIGELEKKLSALSSELVQLKAQISLIDMPELSYEDSIRNLKKINNITGSTDDTPIDQLTKMLEDDSNINEMPKQKTKIKLNIGGNK